MANFNLYKHFQAFPAFPNNFHLNNLVKSNKSSQLMRNNPRNITINQQFFLELPIFIITIQQSHKLKLNVLWLHNFTFCNSTCIILKALKDNAMNDSCTDNKNSFLHSCLWSAIFAPYHILRAHKKLRKNKHIERVFSYSLVKVIKNAGKTSEKNLFRFFFHIFASACFEQNYASNGAIKSGRWLYTIISSASSAVLPFGVVLW